MILIDDNLDDKILLMIDDRILLIILIDDNSDECFYIFSDFFVIYRIVLHFSLIF